MTEYLQRKWLHIRLYRSKSSFMCDYRLLQHFSHLMRMGK